MLSRVCCVHRQGSCRRADPISKDQKDEGNNSVKTIVGGWNTAIVSRGGKRKRTRFDPVKTQERPENRKIEQSDRQKPKEGSQHQEKEKDKILNRRNPSPF